MLTLSWARNMQQFPRDARPLQQASQATSLLKGEQWLLHSYVFTCPVLTEHQTVSPVVVQPFWFSFSMWCSVNYVSYAMLYY